MQNHGTTLSVGKYFGWLSIVTALALVIGLAFASPPARAASPAATSASGDLSLTLSASDLNIAPSYLQAVVNEIGAQDAREHISLSEGIKRNVAEYGGDTSTWVETGLTMSMSSDGSAVTFTIPAAFVQTGQTWWQNAIGATLTVATLFAVQGICISALTLSAVGAGVIPLVCTPLAGGTAAFFNTVWDHYWSGDLGTADSWTDILIKTVAGALGAFVWEKYGVTFFKTTFPGYLTNFGNWLVNVAAPKIQGWFGAVAASAVTGMGTLWKAIAALTPSRVAAFEANRPAAGPKPCDVYDNDTAPCTAAYSTVRALFSYYGGPLYQVQRTSDNATRDIGLLAAGGYVNAAAQDSFCSDTTCTISKVYDQSPQQNDLTVEGAGGAAGADGPASATALPITVAGHKAYGIDFTGQIGYRDNDTTGIAANGAPEGMYMVASGTHVNNGCCFDFGNAETNTRDNGNGHMDTVNFSTTCYFGPCTGGGPWVEADMENGLFQGGNGSNTRNTGLIGHNFVTAMLKNNGQTTYALKGGDSQSGGLSTWWDGGLPDPAPSGSGYKPMQQEGAIVLGTGGDNSNWAVGSFFEGVMTAGYPSDAADAAVQADIVSAGYDGDSGGSGADTMGATPSAAGQAVVHAAGATASAASGFSSVYTVNSSNGHLQETYLPAIGDAWTTQDLSAKYGTPAVMPGTQPVSVVHCGYTSVYTVDAANGDLQETFLPAIGQNWSTQDLSAKYGTPPTQVTPTAVVHYAGATGTSPGCGFTSVYTVDRNHDLQETYLPNAGFPGDPWTTQDLSTKYGTPQVEPGTSPVAAVHCGYTSVYTVDAANHDLQETYLPAIGDPWSTQDLSVNYGTPPTDTTPTAVMHTAGAGGASPSCGYMSVYTVDQPSRHLQETYLPNSGFPGDAWHSQDLSAKYGTPSVAPGAAPVALVHLNYTSVYTVDQGSDQLQETYLPAIGDDWSTQSLSANYGTPTTDQTPIVLLHPDESGNLDWTSVFTINELSNDLQETYLPNTGFPGDAWQTQNLSAKYGTPTVAVLQSSESSWSVAHTGYTSTYTVDASNGHLQETYLPVLGDDWSTQDLSSKYGTPAVAPGTTPEALVHDGYTSVFTVDASNGDLQETYLPAAGFPGDAWQTQDLSAEYGTPQIKADTSPTVVFHDGYTSVYTVDASNHHLQETYLPVLGDHWYSQDLSANYGTPPTDVSPAVLVHDRFTSVYTVDSANHHLQETYLPAIGDPWTTQDLSAKYGTSTVDSKVPPVALYHTGYASVYTLDASNDHLQETYLPAINDDWTTQDLSAKYGTPAPNQAPSPLVHYATNGGLTWTSLFTVDASNKHLDETYLPAINDDWTTQDLSAKYGTPPV